MHATVLLPQDNGSIKPNLSFSNLDKIKSDLKSSDVAKYPTSLRKLT